MSINTSYALRSLFYDVLPCSHKGDVKLQKPRHARLSGEQIGKVTHWMTMQYIHLDKFPRAEFIHVRVQDAVMDETPG